MVTTQVDCRSFDRKQQDEKIAAEPQLAAIDLPDNAAASSMESHLEHQRQRPVAVPGIVENGLVRPLDPDVQLPEHSRVIIVASAET